VVRSHVSYFRNTVIPRVAEFAKEAELVIQEVGTSNPMSELEIYRGVAPDVVQDPAFLSMVESFRLSDPVKPASYSLSLPFTEAPKDMLEVITTSNSRVDGLVQTWLATCPQGFLSGIWYTFFADRASAQSMNWSGPSFSHDDLLSGSPYSRLNVALGYYLMANYYYNNAPNVVIQGNAESLRRRIFEHLSFAAAALCRVIRQLDIDSRSGILVSNIDPIGKRITVNAELYDKWIQGGGSSDIILGVLVGDKRYYSTADIDKNADTLKRIWNNYSTIYAEGVEYRKADVLRAAYLRMFFNYLGEDFRDEVESSYLGQCGNFHVNIMKDAEKLLYLTRKEELDNAYVVAKELIAGLKYRFTYALPFINRMDEIGRENNKVAPEEASFMAVVDYVVDHIHGQISAQLG
jgi:hypothetical protein